MSDPASTLPRSSRGGLFLIILLLLIAGLGVYLAFAQPATPKHLKLALLTWTEDPFWEPLVRGAQDSANQNNVELVVVRSKPTVEAQNAHIKALLDSGVSGIAISPNDAAAQLAILNDAASKVPVVTFDTDAPQSKRRRFVGIDNYAAGHFCADQVREALPGGGAILISVGSATMQHGRDRRQGLIDGLLDRGFDRSRAPDPLDSTLKGAKYSVALTLTDNADPAKAAIDIADALKSHPEVKCVVGLFSYSAPAALAAMKKAGREGQLKVVGFDEAVETQAAIEAGTIHSSILQDSNRAGFEAVQVLANECRGVARGPAEQSPVLNVEVNVLTAKNIAMLRESGALRPMTGASASATPATTQPAKG